MGPDRSPFELRLLLAAKPGALSAVARIVAVHALRKCSRLLHKDFPLSIPTPLGDAAREPQLGSLDMLAHATEIAIVSLCASHPHVEHELDDSASPADLVADRIIDRAMALLEAVDRYRLLLHDPRALDDPPDGDIL